MPGIKTPHPIFSEYTVFVLMGRSRRPQKSAMFLCKGSGKSYSDPRSKLAKKRGLGALGRKRKATKSV